MTTKSGGNDLIRYACTNIPTKSNQDRFAIVESHEKDGLTNVSSFGVFDGHLDELSAICCAEKMQPKIAQSFYDHLYLQKLKSNNCNFSADTPLDDLPTRLLGSGSNTHKKIIPTGVEMNGSKNEKASAPLNFFECVILDDNLSPTEQIDCLLNEAIHQTCLKVDNFLKSSVRCGTTMNSLFLLHNPIDRSFRVACVNIGDSRAVMITPVEYTNDSTVESLDVSFRTTEGVVDDEAIKNYGLSFDQVRGNKAEILDRSINSEYHSCSFDSASPSPISSPCNPKNSIHSMTSGSATEIVFASPERRPSFDVDDTCSASSTESRRNSSKGKELKEVAVSAKLAVLYEMSEDHKVTLERERLRIDRHDPVKYTPLPIEVKMISRKAVTKFVYHKKGAMELLHMNIAAAVALQNFPPLTVKHKHAISYIDRLYEDQANASENNTCSESKAEEEEKESDEASAEKKGGEVSSSAIQLLISKKKSVHKKILERKYRDTDFALADGIKLVHQQSFVAPRMTSNGTVGPIALFSRHNTSILMTRSLGDRYGPRSCCSVPEISACTIPMGKFARFLIASDGFWDVISSEVVRRYALQPAYKDPSEFAQYMAYKAKKMRLQNEMRPDDITVLVVDINPSAYLDVDSKLGCSINRPRRSIASQIGCAPGCPIQ